MYDWARDTLSRLTFDPADDVRPAWTPNGKAGYVLGTDDQGRDVFSTIIFGSRMSLLVGLIATLLAMTFGVTMGLIAGYAGGKVDAFIMRVADIQLSFPSILIALLVDGLFRAALPKDSHDQLAIYVLILRASGGYLSVEGETDHRWIIAFLATVVVVLLAKPVKDGLQHAIDDAE